MKPCLIHYGFIIGFICSGTLFRCGAGASIQPVTPDPAPEAVALLKFFYRISGQHTLTGQHNFPGDKDKHTMAAFRTASGNTSSATISNHQSEALIYRSHDRNLSPARSAILDSGLRLRLTFQLYIALPLLTFH